MTINRRVLALDDDPDDLALIARALVDYYNGSIAIACVATRDDYTAAIAENEWDVILIDYLMPAFTFEQALAVTKHYAPHTPLVVISGALPAEWQVPSGVDGYLMKSAHLDIGAYLERLISSKRAQGNIASATDHLKDRINKMGGDGEG